MVFTTPIGAFDADVHPDTDQAVIVHAADPQALEALRAEVLPDLEIVGDCAVVASDEWAHAMQALEARKT